MLAITPSGQRTKSRRLDLHQLLPVYKTGACLIEPHRHEGVLRGESNPHLLVHSQACRNRYTTRTMKVFC